jgi:hypothetical protein
MVFSGYSGVLYQYNWPPWYDWNIVESGVKHYNPNPSINLTNTDIRLAISHVSTASVV